MKSQKPLGNVAYIIIIGAILFTGGFLAGIGQTDRGQAEALESLDTSNFWKTFNIIQDGFVSTDSEFQLNKEDLVNGAISGMVKSLGDPYSVFFTPEENKEFQESIKGNFSGVGMEVGMEDGILKVIAPLKETPAERSGIKAGDVIFAIDGVTTVGKSVDESIALIRGEKGTEVVITVLREKEEAPIDISITRDVIEIPSLRTEVRDGVFVLSLYNFTGSVKKDFKDALSEFIRSGEKKMILDLRGNPGGFLGASIDIAGYFLEEGKVVLREDFGPTREEKILRSSGGIFLPGEIELVILIDGGSASASEIVAGALSEHGIGTTMGTQTFGKGSVQELVPVSKDTSLKITIAKWLTPKGVSISENGLTPDIVVEFEDEDAETLYDRQLEEAIKFLNK